MGKKKNLKQSADGKVKLTRTDPFKLEIPYPFSEDIAHALVFYHQRENKFSPELVEMIKEQTDIDLDDWRVFRPTYKTWNPKTQRFEWNICEDPAFSQGWRQALLWAVNLLPPAEAVMKSQKKRFTLKLFSKYLEKMMVTGSKINSYPEVAVGYKDDEFYFAIPEEKVVFKKI